MYKCSFVRLACVALALVSGVFTQEYTVGEPNNDEVTFNRVRSADVALIFDTREIVVNPGDQLDLDCGVQGSVRYCIWETGQKIFQVEDVYSNVYEGFSKPLVNEGNECGIVINSATIEHHGEWTCKVFVRGDSLVGSKNVVVTIKPTSPLLEVDTNRGTLEVSNEEESDIKCSVAAARPAVNIRWFLGDKDITVYSQVNATPTDEGGIYKSVSRLRRTFEPAENGRLLVCSISHQTLPVPENATIPISVIFKPLEKPVSTYYQIVLGSDYEVRLNFSANPVPTRTEWKYGESFQNLAVTLPIPDAVDRYSSNIEELGDGHYTARLHITGFTEEDANQHYMLVVENRLGETQYKVRLSMDEAPIDTLSGGAVAGIVIVVLIVVVAVVAAGYARYRQMFCFAPAAAADPEEGKDIKEEHDTESARGPNTTHAANLKNSIGKLTQVFKKPKKDQDTKLEEGVGDEEKKHLTKDELNKDNPRKEQSDEKELPGQTQIPPETTQVYTNSDLKSPEIQNEQTDGKNIEINVSQPVNEQKPKDKDEKNEVVYAELDLSKGESDKKSEVKTEDKTEYAQIIGTVTDNREEEKKE